MVLDWVQQWEAVEILLLMKVEYYSEVKLAVEEVMNME